MVVHDDWMQGGTYPFGSFGTHFRTAPQFNNCQPVNIFYPLVI